MWFLFCLIFEHFLEMFYLEDVFVGCIAYTAGQCCLDNFI